MAIVEPRRRALRALLCALCLYHMAAMLVANLGFNTAFGGELRAPFARYLRHAGLWQNWSMFTTIPYYESIRPVIVARYEGDAKTEHGAMLPGLKPYAHETRLASLFFRFMWPGTDTASYGRVYLQRACAEIAERTHRKPVSVTLRLDSSRLVSLAQARRTGKSGRTLSELSKVVVKCR